MNYIDWHQSKDERPLASDGSQAWLAALAALPRDELSRMANAIEAELEQQRSGASPSRFVIEDSGSSGTNSSVSSPRAINCPRAVSSPRAISSPRAVSFPSRAPAWLLRARDRRPTRSSEISATPASSPTMFRLSRRRASCRRRSRAAPRRSRARRCAPRPADAGSTSPSTSTTLRASRSCGRAARWVCVRPFSVASMIARCGRAARSRTGSRAARAHARGGENSTTVCGSPAPTPGAAAGSNTRSRAQ